MIRRALPFAAVATVALAGLLWAAQEPPPPCDHPDKPWMCGSVEHFCSRDGQTFGPEDEAQHRHPCECRHTCAKDGKPDDETQGRMWDRKCKARCSPSNCRCPHPCGET